MKNTFLGYYRPTQEQFSQLWENCIFVLDANVLLNIYRYTPNTRNGLIDILNTISNRLWVPHQAALEYQQNRLDVINTQLSAYTKIQDVLEKNKNIVLNELKSYSRHPFIKVDEFVDKIESIYFEINEDLNNSKEDHPNLLDDDELRESITNLLDGKIGPPCSQEKLEQIFKVGNKRFENNIPPGYNDKNKDGFKKFGDLILWFQIINYAKSIENPIILITDDRKDDWWLKFNRKIIGPRPELIQEIFTDTGKHFYMYQTEQFMEHAKEHLQSTINQESIDEVRDIRKSDEISKEILGKALKQTLEGLTEEEKNDTRQKGLKGWIVLLERFNKELKAAKLEMEIDKLLENDIKPIFKDQEETNKQD